VYQYKNIEVLDAYDSDTLTLLVKMGFGVDITIKVRLFGINAYEVRGKEREQGLKARDYLRERLDKAKDLIWIETLKDKKGKYGRYLANLYIGEECLNETLVAAGHAKFVKY